MKILSDEYSMLTVLNKETGEKIAVITNGDTPIKTASENIVVKLTPSKN
jgi:hypothetical protein